jgi:putative SOS response-associated peptidase YedK
MYIIGIDFDCVTIMIGYGLISKKEIIENRFQAKIPDGLNYSPNYNLKCEGYCMVLTSANPMQFVSLRHGMVPFWSKEERVLYEAPIEGIAVKLKPSLD